jgi:hypothetical protein
MAGGRPMIVPMRTVRIAGRVRVLRGGNPFDRRKRRRSRREGHQADVQDQGQGGDEGCRLPAPGPDASLTVHCLATRFLCRRINDRCRLWAPTAAGILPALAMGNDQAAGERHEGDDREDAASPASGFPPGQSAADAQGNR